MRSFTIDVTTVQRLNAFMMDERVMHFIEPANPPPVAVDAFGLRVSDYDTLYDIVNVPQVKRSTDPDKFKMLTAERTTAMPHLVGTFNAALSAARRNAKLAVEAARPKYGRNGVAISISKLVDVLLLAGMDFYEEKERAALRAEKTSGSGHAGQTAKKSAVSKTRQTVAA